MFALIILAILVAAYALLFHFTYIRSIFVAWKVDGPTAYPLIGCGLMFINKTSVGELVFELAVGIFPHSHCPLFPVQKVCGFCASWSECMGNSSRFGWDRR